MNNVSIIIPAYNEQARIARTLQQYAQFFSTESVSQEFQVTLLVVLNGCKDATRSVVEKEQRHWGSMITYLDLPQAGKGLAIKEGFAQALKTDADIIGFVDADMATQPRYFYDVLLGLRAECDGVIASRYMPGAYIEPKRPWYKRLGSIIFYESLVRILFGMNFYDYQCGAKVFTRNVVATIVPFMSVRRWEFDVELLYLCKRNGFTICEQPTTWYDQAGSKLRVLSQGLPMLTSLFRLRLVHSPIGRYLLK